MLIQIITTKANGSQTVQEFPWTPGRREVIPAPSHGIVALGIDGVKQTGQGLSLKKTGRHLLVQKKRRNPR